MALSADDIVKYPLKQAVRGYAVPQVDELLDQVADTVEKLSAEVEDLRHRLRLAEDRLADGSETEAMLKRTLVTAQRAAEQTLDEARQLAGELVEEAQRDADRLVETARLEAEELRSRSVEAARAEEADIQRRKAGLESRIEALRTFEQEYRTQMRSQLERHLQVLDDLPERPSAAAQLEEGPALRIRVHGEDSAVDEPAEQGDTGEDAAGEVGSGAPTI